MPISAVAKVAITVALTAAQMAITALQKFEGSRLADLNATTADYGTPLPVLFGRKRIETPIIFAEELREVKKQSKTKGGKYTEYTYFGTWAVAVCDAPIDKVLRIWFDRHLIFDATGAGPMYPFPFTDLQAVVRDLLFKFGNQGKFMRVYTGTELQQPDPRMELTVEAAEGEGACPAYRGVSYIMFEEVPLEKFGNRMPQVSVEATTLGTAVYPFTEKAYVGSDVSSLAGAVLDPDGSTLFWASETRWARWDLFSFTRMGEGPLPVNISTQDTVALSVEGDFYTLGSGGTTLVKYRGPGYVFSEEMAVLVEGGSFAMSLQTDDLYFVGIADAGFGTFSQLYIPKTNQFLSEDIGFAPDTYLSDGQNIWAIGCADRFTAGPVDLQIKCVFGLRSGISTTISTGGSGIGLTRFAALYYAKDESFVIMLCSGPGNQQLWKVDVLSLAVTLNLALGSLDGTRAPKAFLNWRAGESIWLGSAGGTREYSLDDFTLLRTVDTTLWTGAGSDALGSFYIPAVNALFSATEDSPGSGTGEISLRYLDRFTGNGVTLESICDDVATRVGAAADCDFSAFEDIIIPGYAFTQGPAKAVIEPLIEVHDADVRPHDFGLQGVLRGAASVATIDVAFMVPEGGERYTITRAVDTDLPQTVVLTFSDIDKDQQPNTAQSFKRGTESVRNLTLDVSTYACSVDEARPLADRHLRRRWYGNERYGFSVGRRSLALEPGDVVTGGFDDATRTMRLTKVIIGANGIAQLAGERDTPAMHTLGTAIGAPSAGQTEDSIRPAGPTNGFILDLPLVQDGDDQASPFLYYGAGAYDVDAFWPGAAFAVAEDADSEFVAGWAQVASSTRITAGFTTTELASADPTIMDRASTVVVRLQSGTLTSTTEAELLLDATLNLALLGDELVQFTTATPGTGDSYTLSGFRRGARGTEQHVASHAAGERFVLLDGNVFSRTVTASEIGDTDVYLATTQGRDGGTPQSLAFTAAANRPYSPVHGVLTLAAGDWTINATRRTRIGGFNVDGISPPLGETAEMWEADILDGADVVRTLTGTSLPLTYTAAMQTADFGGAQTSLDVTLYQISPALSLRGFPLALAA